MQGSCCDEQEVGAGSNREDEDWKEQLVSESYRYTWNSNGGAA